MTNYFQPWISDQEPKAPEGWGLDALRSELGWKCFGCNEVMHIREQYLYTYKTRPTIVLHNTKECWEKYNGTRPLV